MVHHLVAGLIVQSDRILLGQRSPNRAFYPNVWDVFGGHIEPGEQPVQALVRELKEELGITPTHWKYLESISETVLEDKDISSYDIIAHLYCITSWSGTPVNMQPDEHLVIQWFSYAEAIQLDLAHPSYPHLFAQCLQSIDG
ncbi:MAG TPA: NUDIX hydrolase [Anaerolineales bacterium]|nr:NUDIX hydrolase [Anaerolineales bacterium]